jgi:Tol biopolymer transport system component
MKSEPEWDNLPPNLHSRIRILLERSLEKDPKNRYSSISDARVDIQKVMADPSGVFSQPVGTIEPKTKLWKMMLWASITTILIIIAGIVVWNLRKPEPRQVIRLDYELPEGQQFSNLNMAALAVSPDGQKFVHSTPQGIYVRSINELDAHLIVGTQQKPRQPFFSPDGQWIGYYSDNGELRKISIGGGVSKTLCKALFPRGARWNANNTIVFGSVSNGVRKVHADGGTPESLIQIGSLALFGPQVLPDGKSILFSILGSPNRVMVLSHNSEEPIELFDGDSAQYLSTGHIVYGVGNSLYAAPFDLDKLKASGRSVPIVEGILRVNELHYAISDSGTLVYIPGAAEGAATGRTLVWLDREGKEEPLNLQPQLYRYPKISPDGTQVALTVAIGGNSDIYILDLATENLTKLTFDESIDIQSIWTPDGKRIVFCSDRGGSLYSIYWKASDGSGKAELLSSMPDWGLMPWSWSHDEKNLLMVKIAGGPQFDIGMLSMEKDRAIKSLLEEEYAEGQPKISPDGQWMAYASNESGQLEVYVCPFPEVTGGKWQISTGGGDSPLWSPDGRELFYRSNDSVMAVSVETKPVFKYGSTETLFRGPYVTLGANEGHPWDISPDGKKFLMMKQVGLETSGGPRKINIVLNWFEELKQRVPVD